MPCREESMSSPCSAGWMACGDPTSGPSRSVNDDRDAGDDAMAMATADARRAFVVAAAVVVVAAGDVVPGFVDVVEGWTC